MIADVDKTLSNLLMGELPTVNPRWQNTPFDIGFDAPVTVESRTEQEPRLNIYLHDVRENTMLRPDNVPMRSRPASGEGDPAADRLGITRPPVRLNLSYMVTAHAADLRLEHQLLSDALVALLRHQVVPEKYQEGMAKTTGKATLPIEVAQPDGEGLSNPAALWQALGGKLRPVLTVKVIATVQPFETRWTRVVREVLLGIGQGLPENGGPMPPLDFRSTRASAAGIVTAADGETPLEGVQVRVAEYPEANVRTDERGFFALFNLPPGVKRLRFEKPNYVAREEETEIPPATRLDKMPLLVIALADADGEEKRRQRSGRAANGLQSEWTQQISIHGTLRHPDGSAAAYIPVRLGQRRTITDAQGFYWFADLPDAGSPELVAEVPGVGDVKITALPGDVKNSTAPDAGKGNVKAKPNQKEKTIQLEPVASAESGGGEFVIPVPGTIP